MPASLKPLNQQVMSNQQKNIAPLHPQGTLYEPGESGSSHGMVSP